MRRWLWLIVGAAAVWLWASLVPQVTYRTGSSGEPSGDVLIAWPGWAVQQDLGQLRGTTGRFEFWVSSAPEAGEHKLNASLVDASTKAVVRQTSIRVTPSYTPVARLLTFTAYDVPDGQRLLLQLEPVDHDQRHVIFGLAPEHAKFANLALNGVPDAGSGPLALAHVVTRSDLRAALDGKADARNRLLLALILTGLTALTHPRVRAWIGSWRAGALAKRLARHVADLGRRHAGLKRKRDADDAPRARIRALAAPWYPWPAALTPVLHFFATNSLHFNIDEVLAPAGVVLVAATLAMVGLWMMTRDWHRAAAAVTGVTAVVFAYGHVEKALDSRLDDQVLFPVAAVLVAALLWTSVQHPGPIAQWAPFLNLTATVLLLLQITNVATPSSGATFRTPQLLTTVGKDVSRKHPDIYHLILDAYDRHDSLGEYDNSSFLAALEERGFYVAREATSNYNGTLRSLASSLNLTYLHDVQPHPPANRSDAIALVQYNALASTFKSLGYTYVHLESGHIPSNRAPQADTIVTFTPDGIVQSAAGEEPQPSSTAGTTIRLRAFMRALIDTTALGPIVGHRLLPGKDEPYDWFSPERTLQMFKFLSEPIEASGPKYVFAHIIKPHHPFTFDRHGNMLNVASVEDGFDDTHDPTVPNAYIGQLIHINSLVLRMVDSILENSANDPIIVIASDHGRRGPNRNKTLAAFHLPDGGNNVLYPSISSVNHFRAILDYYFEANLGLLDDVTSGIELNAN